MRAATSIHAFAAVHALAERSRALACSVLSFSVVLSIAQVAAAQDQVLLLVRDGPEIGPDVEGPVADALRDGLGVSVRPVRPTIDELALAAGCAHEATEAACIVDIAHASRAGLVAIEHVEPARRGHRVRLELRRASDGGPIRTMTLQCTTGDACGDQLLRILENEPSEQTALEEEAIRAATATPVRHEEPAASVEATTPEPAPPPPPRRVETGQPDPRSHVRPSIPIAPNVVFGVSVASSIAAMIAGGIGVGLVLATDTAATLGVSTPEQQTHIASLEDTRDLALAIGTGFALAGACLAASAAIAMALTPRGDPRPRLRFSIAVDASSSTLALEGSF